MDVEDAGEGEPPSPAPMIVTWLVMTGSFRADSPRGAVDVCGYLWMAADGTSGRHLWNDVPMFWYQTGAAFQ